MSEGKDEISDLCVSCGMCCDGTLFGNAFVRDADDRKIADDLGMVTSEIKDKFFFKLPCHHFSACCTVYSERRPSTCSAFFCPPIKRHKHGDQTFPETQQQIRLLQDHRDKLLKIASQFPELRDLNFRALKNKLEELADDEERVALYRMLYLILFIFEDLYTKYFVPGKEDTLIVGK
jgi:hypothetical protein